jgi:Resolvase, N terminal domain
MCLSQLTSSLGQAFPTKAPVTEGTPADIPSRLGFLRCGQVAELTAAGCTKVYREKASGARNDRAELAKLMKRLEPGDVLVVNRAPQAHA